MKRIEKSVVNLRYALLYQVVQLGFHFLIRTLMVRSLGDAFVGLNSLFTEVISMLSLAELGVGSAITYSLYKPLSIGDTEHVARLMLLFKRAYQIIAAVILAAGLCLLPFIHLLVREVDFSLDYLRLVYLLFLASTCISYLYAYKSSLLVADQRKFKVTRINMSVDALMMICQLLLLFFLKNFVLFLCAKIIADIVRNLFVTRCADREYPYLRGARELPSREERKTVFRNIRDIFIGRLSGKITNSTDSILISLLDSTLSVGFFSNYNMVLNNARVFLTLLPESASGGIGNLLAEEGPEKCRQVLYRMTFIQYIMAAVCVSGLYSQLTPLIGIWLGEGRMLPDSFLIVCLINFYLATLREPLWKMIVAAGVFQKSKYVSILGSSVNLVVSLVLGLRLGMLGVIIGTTCTHVIQITLMSILIHKQVFKASAGAFLGKWLLWTLVLALSAILGKWLGAMIPVGSALLAIFVRVAVSCLLTSACIVLTLHRTKEFRYALELSGKVVRKIKGKLGRA